MENNKDVIIRPLKTEDFPNVIDILADSFSSKFNKVTNMGIKKTKDFMFDSTFFDDQPKEGYWVAIHKEEIVGVIKLKWDQMKKIKPTKKPSFFKLSKKYGFFNVIKLSIGELILSHTPEKNTCYIEHIAVKESARGLGIGKKLMAIATNELKTNLNLKRLTLYVASDNHGAIKLYEKLGYKTVKVTKSLLSKYLLNEKKWYYMALYEDESVFNKRTFNPQWYLGFLGFIIIFFIPNILDAFTQSGNYWNLLHLSWLFWFLYFIPVKL
jgi:ribosomal protein S18 acetylase RimI-like enzyme